MRPYKDNVIIYGNYKLNRDVVKVIIFFSRIYGRISVIPLIVKSPLVKLEKLHFIDTFGTVTLPVVHSIKSCSGGERDATKEEESRNPQEN